METLNPFRSEAKFSIKYDGPALADHTMNAKDLGSALLAISSLCQEANRVLTGEDANVEVQVTATGEGSFEIGLELVQYATAVAPLFLETGRPTANVKNCVNGALSKTMKID